MQRWSRRWTRTGSNSAGDPTFTRDPKAAAPDPAPAKKTARKKKV